MKPWGRFVLIFLAYCITLLHTIVPHHHAPLPIGESVISHAGCVFSDSTNDLLQKVFSTDLGVGHLETFQKGGDADIEFLATAVVETMNALSAALVITGNTTFVYSKGYIEKLKRRLLLFSVSHFRAPPLR